MRRWLAGVEWPTLGMLVACYAVWALALWRLPAVSTWLAVPVAAWAIAQHSSLTHEAIHGHPTRWRWLNAALVALPLTLAIPFLRFRDSHLAHHADAILTDPYDDPESNFLADADWARLPAWRRLLLRFNNTLAGRLTAPRAARRVGDGTKRTGRWAPPWGRWPGWPPTGAPSAPATAPRSPDGSGTCRRWRWC